MQRYLREPISVPIGELFPDPNNPRLSLDDKPGYEDPEALFDEEVRERIFGVLGESAYNIDKLVTAIVGQGWMPIDSIIVWQPTKEEERYVVVEGNRRRLALERIRTASLKKAQRKLERMEKSSSTYDTEQVEEQREFVAQLEQIVDDTNELTVVEIDAESPDELSEKLPRVLAVRHITGPKEWGNYAEDLWLLERYNQLFRNKHGEDEGRFWDDSIIKQVADEASLSHRKTKWQLKSASWFSHFKAEWEDELPEGEEFNKKDYFLFENIARKPWIRSQFQVGEDDFHIPDDMEETLFKWVFKLPRPGTADDNPNVFFRHQNILLWDKINRYDDDQETSFATRFDPTRPDEAPTMAEVRAEWLSHKARREPHQIIDALLRRLHDIKADDLAAQGNAFRAQLEEVKNKVERFLRMIDVAEE